MATFPSSVKQGKSVSADVAAKMDTDGFALLLGSYDCRFPSSQDERNRVIYSSLLTGQRLDAA
eukprot:9951912-Ditylum_brightwellii.AAC.1